MTLRRKHSIVPDFWVEKHVVFPDFAVTCRFYFTCKYRPANREKEILPENYLKLPRMPNIMKKIKVIGKVIPSKSVTNPTCLVNNLNISTLLRLNGFNF